VPKLDSILQEYIKNHVVKHVKKFDSGTHFDRALVKTAVSLGLFEKFFPNSPNGQDGLRALSTTIEEVSKYCGNTRNFFLVSCAMFGKTIERCRSKSNYLDSVFNEIKNGEAIGSVAYTELEGSSNPKSFNTHLSNLGEGSLILNGNKTWITFAGIADYFLVACLYDGELVFVVVPSSAEGIKITLLDSLAGNRGSALAEITFNQVTVKNSQLLPIICIESGWPTFERIFSVGRVCAASSAIGLTKACIEMCFDRLNSRHSLGKKLIENQIWQQELAKNGSQLRAVEAIRNVALNYLDEDRFDFINSDCTVAKNLGAEIAILSSQLNVKAHGAYGYLENEDPNRLMREALSFEFIEGSSLVLNKKIFTQLAGKLLLNRKSR